MFETFLAASLLFTNFVKDIEKSSTEKYESNQQKLFFKSNCFEILYNPWKYLCRDSVLVQLGFELYRK